MDMFDAEMRDLLTRRLEEKVRQGQMSGIYTLQSDGYGARRYTPEQILEEVKRGTPIGEEFLIAEKRFMDEMKKRM